MTAASPPASDRSLTGSTTNLSTLAGLLALQRPLVMGILNVTPDSFSDGGAFLSPDAALAHAEQMIAEGADIIDIGGESTRPSADRAAVSAEEELQRLELVLPAAVRLGRPVSIDTMKATVAAWALDRGAAIVNDVWGLQRDPAMADVIADIAAFFERSLAIAARASVRRDQIVLDPGIGFGKTPEQSMMAIARLDRLKAFGLPLLVGASRKSFINAVVPSPPDRRLGGSIAAHVLAAERGAALIRTHDVAATVQALRVMAAIEANA